MTNTIKEDDFWSRVENVQAGMMNVADGRPVPMSHYVDRDENCLWFITAKGTDLEEALRGGPENGHYTLACGHGKIYANIEGRAQLSNDRAKLDELWNAVAGSWFEGGKTDPDVQLVKFDLTSAEVWATDGAIGFLYEIAKAKLTDEKPDMGGHGVLQFTA